MTTKPCVVLMVWMCMPAFCVGSDEQVESPSVQAVLDSVDGELLLDGVAATGSPFGVIIIDLNRAAVSDDLVEPAMKLRADLAFQAGLCDLCKKPETCFEAYALLNTLYPEHSFHIVTSVIFVSRPAENTHIPVKLLSGDTLIPVSLSIEEFGAVSAEYWRQKLGLFTAIERDLIEALRRKDDEERSEKVQAIPLRVDGNPTGETLKPNSVQQQCHKGIRRRYKRSSSN